MRKFHGICLFANNKLTSARIVSSRCSRNRAPTRFTCPISSLTTSLTTFSPCDRLENCRSFSETSSLELFLSMSAISSFLSVPVPPHNFHPSLHSIISFFGLYRVRFLIRTISRFFLRRLPATRLNSAAAPSTTLRCTEKGCARLREIGLLPLENGDSPLKRHVRSDYVTSGRWLLTCWRHSEKERFLSLATRKTFRRRNASIPLRETAPILADWNCYRNYRRLRHKVVTETLDIHELWLAAVII